MARPESGLTLRRLNALVEGLPAESRIWEIVRAEYQRSLKPTAEQIRDRQAHYRRLGH